MNANTHPGPQVLGRQIRFKLRVVIWWWILVHDEAKLLFIMTIKRNFVTNILNILIQINSENG